MPASTPNFNFRGYGLKVKGRGVKVKGFRCGRAGTYSKRK